MEHSCGMHKIRGKEMKKWKELSLHCFIAFQKSCTLYLLQWESSCHLTPCHSFEFSALQMLALCPAPVSEHQCHGLANRRKHFYTQPAKQNCSLSLPCNSIHQGIAGITARCNEAQYRSEYKCPLVTGVRTALATRMTGGPKFRWNSILLAS